MKVLKTIPLLIIALFSTANLYAQVTANFVADKNTGCPPSLTVNFTNASTPETGVTYAWDFGNGATSTIKNPQAVFLNPGFYTVKLTVTDGSNTDIKTMVIRVYNPPVADFKANPVKGCAPLITQFTDLSTKGDGTINKWEWDYRNGVTSTKAIPDPVTYNNQGKFSIYLKVTDSNGCSAQSDKPNYIDVASKPRVSFVPTPDKSCKVPQMVTFNNTSTGTGTLTYEWDLGNGDQQFTRNVTTTYNAYGIYNVKLRVNATDYNCYSELQYPAVNIAQIKAGASLKQDTITIKTNDTICAGMVLFTNQSQGATNFYWNFGDGSSSYLTNASHSYNNHGKYAASLIASASGSQCSDTARWIINVEKVTSDFSFTPTTGCTSPIPVTFTNNSSNAVSYKWEFHDNTTSTQTNVNKTFNIIPDKDPYVIHKETEYPITLNARGPHGCASKITKGFKVNLPTALYSVDRYEGCAPLTVTFTDKSLPGGNITTRNWVFGDNTTQTVPSSTILHTYLTPGIYESKLIVTDINSCKDTSYSITIKVGKKPQPNFQVTSPASFYSDQLVSITDLTPAGDNVNFWRYSINGNNIPNCPNVKNPIFLYKVDTGKLSVKLTVGSNGCYEDTVFNNIITNLGPISSFSYDFNCTTPLVYNFTGVAKGATSYEWDFGDGAKNSSTLTPQHTYSTAGNYFVKLITVNNGHRDTASSLIYVRIPNATFTTKVNSCIYDTIKFYSAASHPIFTTCKDKYKWDFGDGSQNIITSTDSVEHFFNRRGNFNVKLTALYENGCTSSYTQAIRIFSPIANLLADTTSGCDNLLVRFTDASTIDGSGLTQWKYDFANGTDSVFASGGHSFNKLFSLPIDYSSFQFPVVLTVKDAQGCIGTDTVNIRISRPTANFYVSSASQLCASDSAKFIRYFPEADSVIWYFGDQTISRDLNIPVAHKYNKNGNFGVALKIYKYYCTDSVSKPQGFIQIHKADASFSISESILNCNGKITFIHNAEMSPVDSGTWDFGDGYKGTYNDTVEHYYFTPMNDSAFLRVYTSFGCADTFGLPLKVFAPYADIAMNPRKACKGDTVTFHITDKENVHTWNWNFGEGEGFSNKDTVKYAFKSTGNKPVSLVVYREDPTCQHKIFRDFPVDDVIAQIGVTDTSVCAGTEIVFNNLSTGQTSFIWNLGNGITSTDNNPLQTYSTGTYNITLSVSNDNGCKDTAVQAMLINPIPVVTVSNDTVLCRGSSLILHATGGNSISWTPNKWISQTNIYHPTINADTTIQYVAEVSIDTTGCTAKDSVMVTVQQVPVYNIVPGGDTAIFVGDEITMNITGNETYLYTWEPQTYILCNSDCSSATVKPEDSITYQLTVKDVNNCFSDTKKIKLTIKDTCIFGVAGAFTPGGEEQNRILKVQGKGIKQLLEFKIYNRWGNVVFQSNDISVGWDGTYQGKAQPIDSYIYTITVLTYKGFTLSKKGSVLLIR